MRSRVMLLAALLLVSACAPDQDDFKPVCLEGVSYWFSYVSGYPVMVPRYDRTTKQIALCSGNSNPAPAT